MTLAGRSPAWAGGAPTIPNTKRRQHLSCYSCSEAIITRTGRMPFHLLDTIRLQNQRGRSNLQFCLVSLRNQIRSPENGWCFHSVDIPSCTSSSEIYEGSEFRSISTIKTQRNSNHTNTKPSFWIKSTCKARRPLSALHSWNFIFEAGYDFSSSASRNFRRSILPTLLLGKSSTHSTSFGILYPVKFSRQ